MAEQDFFVVVEFLDGEKKVYDYETEDEGNQFCIGCSQQETVKECRLYKRRTGKNPRLLKRYSV
jgi:hypothetical protein